MQILALFLLVALALIVMTFVVTKHWLLSLVLLFAALVATVVGMKALSMSSDWIQFVMWFEILIAGVAIWYRVEVPGYKTCALIVVIVGAVFVVFLGGNLGLLGPLYWLRDVGTMVLNGLSGGG